MLRILALAFIAVLLLTPLRTDAAGATIDNDAFWKDQSGVPVYSQGGGILKVGSIYYWYGVKYDGAVTYAIAPTGKNSNTTFAGVTCYSSKDLVNWKDEGLALTPDQAGPGWFGRVGVVYNSTTKMYVLIGQGSSPDSVNGEYFATSSTPDGAFKFSRVQTNMTFFVNGGTGDQTVFQDDDGKAYVICSSVNGRSNLYVAPLRTSDYLAIESTPTRIYKGAGREGNAMFKNNGTYYFCSSDLHGWNASHTYCMSSKSILGTYSPEFVLDGTDADFSHVSQTGFFLTVNGTKQSTVIFAGDRWSDFAGNGLGYNQWCPISFNGTTPHFNSLSQWTLDATTGEWSVGKQNNYVLNPGFEADRVSQSTLAGWTVSPADTLSINSTSHRTGRFGLYLTGTKIATQAITGIPNGTYDLTAWVRSSGGQTSCQLFANGTGGSDLATPLNAAMSGWTEKTIKGIKVTNETVKVGIISSGAVSNWVNVDDFKLTSAATTVELGHAALTASGPTAIKVHGGMSFVLPVQGREVRLDVFALDGRPLTSFLAKDRVTLRERGLAESLYVVRISD